MILQLQRILFGLAAILVATDLIWGVLGHFQVDAAAYARLGLLALALVGGGIFYQTRRPDPQIAAMLMGAGFLVLFCAAASVLNYFLLTVAGPRIDAGLAAADRALGFDWYRVMLTMAHHPLLNAVFFRVYNMVLPQIALVLIALAWSGQAEKAYRFCLAVAAGALIAIFIWTLAPSFGAMSLHTLPPGAAHRLMLSVTSEYGNALVALLRNGPGLISPADLRGLIGFPSYHGVLALIAAWYGWRVRVLRWPLLVINAGVLVSTPVQGGHHLVDVLAAFPVTALALFLAGEFAGRPAKTSVLVNEAPIFAAAAVPKGLFRITPAQARDRRARGD